MPRSSRVLAAVLAMAAVAHADPAERWDGHVVGAVFEGEALGLVGGGCVGLLGGIAVGVGVRSPGDQGIPVLVGAVIGSGVGAAVGLTVGAQLLADHEGGSGRFWGTAIGGVLSIGAASALYYFGRGEKNENHVYEHAGSVILGGIALLIAGPFLGYELTSNAHASTTARIAPLALFAF